jgi:hypothetical protein
VFFLSPDAQRRLEEEKQDLVSLVPLMEKGAPETLLHTQREAPRSDDRSRGISPDLPSSELSDDFHRRVHGFSYRLRRYLSASGRSKGSVSTARAVSRPGEGRGAFGFPAPTQHPQVVFAFFKQNDAYFPPPQKATINLQVDDLDGVLDRLTNEGVTVDPKRESNDFGKFGWIMDPQGNRVEPWQPAPDE